MRLVITTFVCLLFTGFSSGQGSFNKLLQTNALNNQSHLYDVYADSINSIVIGDWIDTLIDPNMPMIRSWIGKLDYHGNLISQNSIFIKELNGFISASGSKILKAENNNVFYSTMYFDSSEFAKTLLMKINTADGKVLRHRLLFNQLDSSKWMLPGWFSYLNGDSTKLICVNSVNEGDHDRNIIYITDTLFNIIDTILIDYNGRDNYIYYLDYNADSNYVAIGDSWDRNTGMYFPEVNLFYMKFNFKGEILDFNIHNNEPNNLTSMSTSDSYNVLKKDDGGWIIACTKATIKAQCSGCLFSTPIVYAFDHTLENLIWKRQFTDDLNDYYQLNTLYASAKTSNNSEALTIGIDNSQPAKGSYIFKYSLEGDSIWKRYYLPLNWDSDSVLWAILKDIKKTPDGNFVSVGQASDKKSGMWRSWVIQIDSFGCLIPGCQITQVDNLDKESNPFKFYPNPSNGLVYFMLTTEIYDKVSISLYDVNGKAIKHLTFVPAVNDQYILACDDCISGVYFITIRNYFGSVLQVQKIIIEK